MENNKLDKSIKAVKSFKELFDNGPLMTILTIQTIAIIVLVYIVMKQYDEKGDIQAQLYQQMIDRTDAIIEYKMLERVSPIMEDTKEAVDSLNITRENINGAYLELRKFLNKNDRK